MKKEGPVEQFRKKSNEFPLEFELMSRENFLGSFIVHYGMKEKFIVRFLLSQITHFKEKLTFLSSCNVHDTFLNYKFYA